MTDAYELLSRSIIRLRSRQDARLRLLMKDDAALLGAYLTGLSKETVARWGPHKMDQATANEICANLDPAVMVRVIATVDLGGDERIISYMLLRPGVDDIDTNRFLSDGIEIHQETDCTFAPSVADAYQDQGVASLIMPHVLALARNLGFRRMVLMWGVIEANERAVHFYQKWGFVKTGEFFTDKNNYNMILELIGK